MPTPTTFFSLRLGTDCSGGPIRYLLRYPGIFVIIGLVLLVIGVVLAVVIPDFILLIIGAVFMFIGALGNFIVRLRQLSAHKSRRERNREEVVEDQTQNTDQVSREQETAAQEPAPKYNDVVPAAPSTAEDTSNPTETPLLSTQESNPQDDDSPSSVVVESEKSDPPPPSYDTAVDREGEN
ncbi:uncharacterized protein [Ptychodera flava]|uniref:uncharacterized protein n=1 Tax=Ptychodera flava TaxID=63121 RepID=UPI00396A6C95